VHKVGCQRHGEDVDEHAVGIPVCNMERQHYQALVTGPMSSALCCIQLRLSKSTGLHCIVTHAEPAVPLTSS
jgi:hypothetical protein